MNIEYLPLEVEKFLAGIKTAGDIFTEVRKAQGRFHVSDLIRAVEFRSGMRDGNIPDDRDELQTRLVWEMGLSWERVLGAALFAQKGMSRIPGDGTIELDGLIATPDAVDYATGEPHECKATWGSSKYGIDLEKRWNWKVQLASYCRMLSSNSGVFNVVYLCGDYTRPFRPQVAMARVTYTDDELKKNWDMLLSERDKQNDTSS